MHSRNYDAMAAYTRARDPSRPIHYESCGYNHCSARTFCILAFARFSAHCSALICIVAGACLLYTCRGAPS